MDKAPTTGRRLLTFGTLFLALNEGVALSPVPPPAIPPDIRLTIDVKDITVDDVLDVYRAFELAATRAQLTCRPTMKDYESWREKGFEPMTRTMVCSDSHAVLIDASWVNVAPKSIDIDVRFGSKTEPSTKSRMQQLVRELEKSLKEDPSVTSLTRDTWSPEHLSSQIK
jgi:hypothetical protein